MKTCVCEKPVIREVKSNGGEILALFCSLCTRPVTLNCPACKKSDLKDLQAHFRAAPKCFAKADPIGFKEWKKTVSGMAATEKGAA
jgi:hypothetical protein